MSRKRQSRFLPLLLIPICCLAAPGTVRSEEGPETGRQAATGTIEGLVIDQSTGDSLGWTQLRLVELKRREVAHSNGQFHFYGVPAGSHTFEANRLGYQPRRFEITVTAGDTLRLRLELRPTAIQGADVVVQGTAERRVEAAPDAVLSGKKLQQQLGQTISATLAREPGIAERSMGPAAARPVVRGLGGDRLRILEDGGSSGDMSATSGDHAVAIDPLTTERIEIIRGPAALLHSANSLGGVINLVRDRIASHMPDRIFGTASLQGESVNSGYAGGLSFALPAGPIAIHFDGSVRRTDAISTPAGILPNTDASLWNGSIGASYILPWGYAGVSGGLYNSSYGIPGGFVGSHPNGVRIDIERQESEGIVTIFPDDREVRQIELRTRYTRYHHIESEAAGAVGTEYGLLTSTTTLAVHHGEMWGLTKGTLSLGGDVRDFASGGGSRTPNTTERSGSVSLFEEALLGPITLQGALRFDLHTLTPAKEETTRIGVIRERAFPGFSGSLSAGIPLSDGLLADLTVTRSFRPPTVEELFSGGPHLATYSEEIGNPDLQAETGVGAEVRMRYTGDDGYASISLFRNDISGYIFPRNTGEMSPRLFLPVYRHTGEHVVMQGGEISGEWEPVAGIVAGGSLSYVEGSRAENDQALPMIPPLSGRFNVRYTKGPLTIGLNLGATARQDRIGEFEEPTAGYLLAGAFAQYQLIVGTTLHTLILAGDNLLDTEYRNHLSRTKSFMPEAGRNIRVLYRVYF